MVRWFRRGLWVAGRITGVRNQISFLVPDTFVCPFVCPMSKTSSDSVTGFVLDGARIRPWMRCTWASPNAKVNWIIDADIRGFFDNISHEWLMKFLEHRIADRRMLRLLKKWLRAGVSEDGEWSPTKVGTPQGAVISPLLANVFLHYVLDLWIDDWRKRHAKGEVIIVRYADDFVIGFREESDARKCLAALKERFAKFGLELHPEKDAADRIRALRRPNEARATRRWPARRHSTSWVSRTSVGSREVMVGLPSIGKAWPNGCERRRLRSRSSSIVVVIVRWPKPGGG